MAHPRRWQRLRPLALGVLALWLAGCVPQPRVSPPSGPPPDLAPFRPFVVPVPLAPFEAQGAAQYTYRGERESGDLQLQALPGAAFRLELRSPLTGGVALELWLLPRRLRVIDYVNETWLLAENTPEARRRLFAVDLSPTDLQILLTGRVDRARFESGGGAVSPAGDEAAFREGEALHRFRLGPHGLPTQWVKETPAGPAFRVEFREYLAVEAAGAEPLWLPRKVRLYGSEPEALLVLGLRTVQPGAPAGDTPAGQAPHLEVLPPAARDFAPRSLPER